MHLNDLILTTSQCPNSFLIHCVDRFLLFCIVLLERICVAIVSEFLRLKMFACFFSSEQQCGWIKNS